LAERAGVTAPTISVVIPAYCAERFLAASIESVLAQELAAHEIIVVDDGSTDHTSDVIRSFGDQVRAVTHAANRGEAAARNTGLAAATGEAIAMHDADDLMRPHRLQRQWTALTGAGRPGEVGCALGRQEVFSDDDRPIPSWMLDRDGQVIPYGNSLVLAWCTTYDRVGGYDEGFRHGTDSDWLVRVRAAGLEVVVIDEVLTDRRIHGANATERREGPAGQEFARSLLQVLRARRRGQD
jgi:glycosyltransferase involved in cell wall biosynthesis